jgi:hypothetical protein
MDIGRVHLKITIDHQDERSVARRLERIQRVNRRLDAVDADRRRWATEVSLRPWRRA